MSSTQEKCSFEVLMNRRRVWLVVASVVSMAAACGDSTGLDAGCGRAGLRPCVAAIDMSAPSTRLLEGGTLRITAIPRDSAGAGVPSVKVTWRSSDTSIVTVNDEGLVVGVAHGTADVIASAGTLDRSFSVAVVPRPDSCGLPGTIATGVADSAVWRTADGPFHVVQTVVVTGRLLIESGALVCGAADAVLQIGFTGGGWLRAHGTAEDAIVFTAADPAHPWGGILAVYAVEIDLRFVRVEAAKDGINAWNSGATTVADAEIARISGTGVVVGRSGSVSRTTVTGTQTGIRVDHGNGVDIRQVIVRNPAQTGLLLWRSRVGLHDVRVENSGAVGIALDGLTGVGLTGATDVVVQGSAGAGVRISALNVTLSGCSITDGAADGVLVTGGLSVAIHGCNLSANAGVGVRNTSLSTVDASRNWWGDPAGPAGPNGDGVAGDVVVTPVLAEPVPAGSSDLRVGPPVVEGMHTDSILS